MRVLYVNHTSRVSGGERSLLELLELARTDADVFLACPTGDLMRRAKTLGVTTVELSPPQLGFSSGPRQFVPALLGLARAGLQVRVLSRRHDIDVVHAASTRAGLLTSFCLFSHARRVVDVRDLLPNGIKAGGVRWVLRLSAHVLVFNSKFTQHRFGPTRPAKAEVVYPPVNIEPFLELPLPSQKPQFASRVLGVVGQITPWKGQDDAIRILAVLRAQFPNVHLRIVGSVVFTGRTVSFDNEAFRGRLSVLATELGVADAVEFAEENEDIRSVLASLDVLLVPSWEEPFGRIVAEGMAAGVPVIATNIGGPAEIVEDGISGFLLPPRSPNTWTTTVTRLLSDSGLSAEIAAQARRRIKRLDSVATYRRYLPRLYGDRPLSSDRAEHRRARDDFDDNARSGATSDVTRL